MSASLLVTKLYIPLTRSNLVSRPRLVEILEKGLRGPVTIISAPAGSGKTTLMGEWHQTTERHVPIAWSSLDSAENDPFRFLTYLIASFRSAASELKGQFLDFQSSQAPAIEFVTSSLVDCLASLISDLILVVELVGFSNQSRQIVCDTCDHYAHMTTPDIAIESIRQMLALVRH